MCYSVVFCTSSFISDDDVNVQQDHEIQAFRQELLLPRKTNGKGGCGMNVCLVNFIQCTCING